MERAFQGVVKAPKYHPISSKATTTTKGGGGSGDFDFFEGLQKDLGNFEGGSLQTDIYFNDLHVFNQTVATTKQRYHNSYMNTYGGDRDMFMRYESGNMAQDMAQLIAMQTSLQKMNSIGKRTIDYFNKSEAFKSEFFDNPAYLTDGSRANMMMPFQDNDGNTQQMPYDLNRGQYAQMMERTADFNNPFPSDVMTPDFDILDDTFKELKAAKGDDIYSLNSQGKRVLNGDVMSLLSEETWEKAWLNPDNKVELRLQFSERINSIERDFGQYSRTQRESKIEQLEQSLQEDAQKSKINAEANDVDARYTSYMVLSNLAILNMFKEANNKFTMMENGQYNQDSEYIYKRRMYDNYKSEWTNNRTATSIKFADIDRDPTSIQSKQQTLDVINSGNWDSLPTSTGFTITEIEEMTENVKYKIQNNAVYRKDYNDWFMRTFNRQIANFTRMNDEYAGWKRVEDIVTYKGQKYSVEKFDISSGKAHPGSGVKVYGYNNFIIKNKSTGNEISVPVYNFAKEILKNSGLNAELSYLSTTQGNYDMASISLNYIKNKRVHKARPKYVAEIGRETHLGTHWEDATFFKGDDNVYPIIEQVFVGASSGTLPFPVRVLTVDRIAFIDDGEETVRAARVIGVLHEDDIGDAAIGDVEDTKAHDYDDALSHTEFEVKVTDKGFKHIEYKGSQSAVYFNFMTPQDINDYAKTLRVGTHYIYPFWSKRHDYWAVTDLTENEALIEDILDRKDNRPNVAIGDPSNYLPNQDVQNQVNARMKLESNITTK
jgi:hypothetical protein